jgi:hypothetical protein
LVLFRYSTGAHLAHELYIYPPTQYLVQD